MMIRSILSIPAHRADFAAKARERGADIIAWDLEDSVPSSEKDAACLNLANYAAETDMVRVHHVGHPRHAEDLELAAALCGWVNLPKVTCAAEVELVKKVRSTWRVLAVIESPVAVRNVDEIASVADALAFGRADFLAECGLGYRQRLVKHAMGEIALAALAAGIPSYDSPCERLEAAAMRAEVERARGFGFTGKICINPSQLLACRAFDHGERDFVMAQELSGLRGSGGMVVEGRFVAEPHYRLAERVLEWK